MSDIACAQLDPETGFQYQVYMVRIEGMSAVPLTRYDIELVDRALALTTNKHDAEGVLYMLHKLLKLYHVG